MTTDFLKSELFEAFANASDKVFVYACDMKCDLSRWSQNTVDYFGLEGEYIENAGSKWVEKIHPDDREVYLRDIEKVFSGNAVRHNCQYRAKNRYNDYVWLECKGSVIPDSAGNPSLFAGLMTRLDDQNKYDPLTHLLTGFEVQSYNFSSERGAMMLIGINEFRKINNRSGYVYGNRVLKVLADQLLAFAGPRDKVYRLQGDEFIIISSDNTKEGMQALFEQISNRCSNMRLAVDGVRSFSISAGIVGYPEDGNNYNVLLSNMEHSLEYVKEHRKEAAAVFSPKIAERHNRISLLHELLTRSICNNFEGFELYFQPILDSRTRQIVKCEALLRWKCPEVQNSSPYEFIKILEESGEIREVGFWVMEEALRYAAKWQQKYGNICVSFNVSYLQLTDDEFVEKILEASDTYGIEPSQIMVELTESCNVEDVLMLSRYFEMLRSAGFQIAMDDFGTEYASLGLLHDVSMDVLKIDQKFVRGLLQEGGMKDLTIIESVVDMCRRLSIQTIAEGIETEEIQDMIREIGVSYLQGYLYSRPVPAPEFEKMLEKRGIQ